MATTQTVLDPSDNSVRGTAHRRQRAGDQNVRNYNEDLATAEAWQEKYMVKTKIVVNGETGEGRITMVKRRVQFAIRNALSGIMGQKRAWVKGITVKWAPSCDFATSGTITLSLLNDCVTNPVYRDHTILRMKQRIITPFEVSYCSHSSIDLGNTNANPWSYMYNLDGIDDLPRGFEIGEIKIMPTIRIDDKSGPEYDGVECDVFLGEFPMNIPAISYCAPGPRFKTNYNEIYRQSRKVSTTLKTMGFSDVDDEVAYQLIQCCDSDTSKALLTATKIKAFGIIDKESKDFKLIEQLVHDVKSGRVMAYNTLAEAENMSTKGGNKKHKYY